MQTPSVGRVVHYVSYGTPKGEFTSQCRAAIIAGLPDGTEPVFCEHDGRHLNNTVVAELVVLNPTGLFFNTCPSSHGANLGGTWHWPERVA